LAVIAFAKKFFLLSPLPQREERAGVRGERKRIFGNDYSYV
jgi:hypothetical protein